MTSRNDSGRRPLKRGAPATERGQEPPRATGRGQRDAMGEQQPLAKREQPGADGGRQTPTERAGMPAAGPARHFAWIERVLEGCWLVAAAFLPVFIMPETVMVGFVQVPKVFLLRSVALLAVVLVTVEWALRRRDGQPLSDDVAVWRAWFPNLGRHAKANPIMASAVAVLLVTMVGASLSPLPVVSIEGARLGWDGYALYSVASWVVLFGLVASRMRTRAQFERLAWALTGAAVVLGLYGVGQHFGIDPFRLDDSPKARVPLTVGNPIFGASVLLMAMPLALAVWQGKREAMGGVGHVLLGAALLFLPLTAFLFTLARGGFVGFGLAMAVFAAATVWLLGRRALYRLAVSFGIAVAAAVAVSFIPVPGGTGGTTGDILDRFESIAPEVAGPAGGLNGRYNIWRVAGEALFTGVWPDSEEYPEVPGLLAEPVRPFIGYGPDMFGSTYNLLGDAGLQQPPDHAHNFPIHVGLELGLLGLAAYGALVLFLGLALWRLLLDAKRGATPMWATFLLIGAVAVFLGRLLEQQVGKAQVGDLTMAWVLAGAVVALLRLRNTGWAEAPGTVSASASGEGRQTAPRRRRPAQRQARSAPPSMPHLVLAGVMAIGALAFWWQAVGSTALAASMTGRGIMASVNGDQVKATALLEGAIAVSPRSYTPRYVMSVSWQRAAMEAEDELTAGQSLANALTVLRPVLERDPMSRQALVRRADVLDNLATLNRVEYLDDALRAWEVVLKLMPGLWEVRHQAATVFISYGEVERGLELIEELRAQGATLAENRLDYLHAKVLLLLGRAEEAQPFVGRIEASDAQNAGALVEDLRATEPLGA